MKLILRTHPHHRDIYITADGRVFREIPVTPDANGYGLVKIGKMTVRRHVLMLEAFKGPRPSAKHVSRHLNGKPSDDRPENLEWGTQKENGEDTVLHGTSTRGIRNPCYKLTEDQVCDIKRRLAAGETATSILQDYYVSQTTIYDIKAERTWGWLKIESCGLREENERGEA